MLVKKLLILSLFIGGISYSSNAALLWRTWHLKHSSGWCCPTQGPFYYYEGDSWLWGKKCTSESGNTIDCPIAFYNDGEDRDNTGLWPSTMDGYTLYNTTINGETIYYTIENTDQEIKDRLTAAGYDYKDDWFNTVEGHLSLCPTPTFNGFVTDAAADLPPYCAAKMTGINNVPNDNFKIYPNPTNGILNFKSANGIISIEVYNILGQSVFTHYYKEMTKPYSIDISVLAKGTYSIRIKTSLGLYYFPLIKN